MASESNHGALSSLAERVIHRVVQNSAFFYYARTHFYWGTMKRMRRALDLQPGERLLDVGCGSGMGAGLTTGTYIGVDNEMSYLRFAHGRLRARPTHSFACMSAMQLAFADGAFDKAMMLNLVHHLDETILDRFLLELTRVVRKQVFILDHAPDHDNAVSGWLLSLDRGAHIRRRAELRALLTRHYDIANEEAFFNLEHTISHVLFTLVPRRPGAA
jgi:ubiquinone/menaquinone biosynthesis C-methylase UbiE